MNFSEVQYVADQQGHPTGVLIPITIWREIQASLATTNPSRQTNAWDVLDGLTGSITAPPDWAEQHDHYLYGTPKRQTVDQA